MFDLTSFSGGAAALLACGPWIYAISRAIYPDKASLSLKAEILHVDEAGVRALTFVYKEIKR